MPGIVRRDELKLAWAEEVHGRPGISKAEDGVSRGKADETQKVPEPHRGLGRQTLE